MAKQLEKVYDPKQVEDRTYQFWLDKNYFHADAESKKEPYTIVIRPPISPASCIWGTRWIILFKTR